MSIKKIETRLNKMSISNIQNICKKMKVKCTGKSKKKMIQELMSPLHKQYKMFAVIDYYSRKGKRKRGESNKDETSKKMTKKCHNEHDLLGDEFETGKYVNLGKYCVSLEDISGMVDGILTEKMSEVDTAYLRTLANPYTNKPLTQENISDIRKMLKRNKQTELLKKFEISRRQRTIREQVELSNDVEYYETDEDSDDDTDAEYVNIFPNYESGDEIEDDTDIDEEIEQISTEAEAIAYLKDKPTSEVFVELIHKFPNIESQLEAIVFD